MCMVARENVQILAGPGCETRTAVPARAVVTVTSRRSVALVKLSSFLFHSESNGQVVVALCCGGVLTAVESGGGCVPPSRFLENARQTVAA